MRLGSRPDIAALTAVVAACLMLTACQPKPSSSTFTLYPLAAVID